MNLDSQRTPPATSKTGSGPEKRRIFLVDDHPIIQQALADMLNHEPDLEVCATGKNAHVTPEQIERLDPDLEVLRLLGQALRTRQIAKQLHLSVKTIEYHRAHHKQKLNLKTGADLIQYAIRLQGERFDHPPETVGTGVGGMAMAQGRQ